jgi:hypothetical protein
MSFGPGCYYLSVWGQAFGLTQMVPTAVTCGLTLLTAATGEPVYFFFGLYLYIPQGFTWVFQYYFQWIRPNPVCQAYQTWAFPSTESMYVGAFIGAFVSFVWAYQIYHTWTIWFIIYLVGIVPPFILVYMQYNIWYEVVMSMALGLVAGILFSVVMRNFVRPKMPYLMLHFPLWICGYKDTILAKNDQCLEIERSLYKLDEFKEPNS